MTTRKRSTNRKRFTDIVITRRKRLVATFIYVVILALVADYADLGKSMAILKEMGTIL